MKINNILEALFQDNFDIVSTTLYKNLPRFIHGNFTLEDTGNNVEYSVDIFIQKETMQYKIESIVVTDDDEDHDGDFQDEATINNYLANNTKYVFDQIMDSD